ncbi:MAG: hypothetical protein ACLQUY_08705 [Ktedonobacterales bacterium]
MTTVKSAPNLTASPTRSAPQSPRAPKSSGMGRRALLAVTATAGVLGVTALAVPQIRNSLEQDATALGRQALAHELASLEGITLDEAIKAAEITQAAVRFLVLPLAQLIATIGGDGLAVLLAALSTATNVLASVDISVAALSGLRDTVASWHEHIASLPIALTNYSTADIASAEAYLKALKKQTQQ